MPSIPFVWCWWWDVQSSVNLTPLMDLQRRAPATRCGFQMQSICCTKCKVPPTKKDPKVFLVLVVGRAVKCQLDSADGQAKTGASHTVWVPNAKHLLHKVQKSHQQKKTRRSFWCWWWDLNPHGLPHAP